MITDDCKNPFYFTEDVRPGRKPVITRGSFLCVFFWESSWLTFFGVMLHLDLFMTGRLGGTD